MLIEIILACIVIAFSTWKSYIIFPKILWLCNHEFNFGELRAKKYAANNTNGVVGKMGKNAPITPNAKLKTPKPAKNILIQNLQLEFIQN